MKFVKSLHGFGDYAAGNVAMLLGFYEEIPLDSETVGQRRALCFLPSLWGQRYCYSNGEEDSEAKSSIFIHILGIDTQTYSSIPYPISSLQVRHFKDYHGVTTKNVREVAPRARQQYASFAPYQVREATVTSSSNWSTLRGLFIS